MGELPLGLLNEEHAGLDGAKCSLCRKQPCTLVIPHTKLHMCQSCDKNTFGYMLSGRNARGNALSKAQLKAVETRGRLFNEDEVYRRGR